MHTFILVFKNRVRFERQIFEMCQINKNEQHYYNWTFHVYRSECVQGNGWNVRGTVYGMVDWVVYVSHRNDHVDDHRLSPMECLGSREFVQSLCECHDVCRQLAIEKIHQRQEGQNRKVESFQTQKDASNFCTIVLFLAFPNKF